MQIFISSIKSIFKVFFFIKNKVKKNINEISKKNLL